MNILSKALIQANRWIDPEFKDYYDNQMNKNSNILEKGIQNEPLSSVWDASHPERINLSEYGIYDGSNWTVTEDKNTKKKLAEKRHGNLTYHQMWELYLTNSLIRACVDTKAKQISSMQWDVSPHDLHPLLYSTMTTKQMERKKYLEKLFYNPNPLDESFPTLITKVLTDLLIFDAGAIRKIYNKDKQLVGLMALHGPDLRYIINKDRMPIGFYDVVNDIKYSENEIIYLKLFPNTNSFYGNPALESIIPEVTGDIYSMLYNTKYFSENEVPDGLLYLGDIDQFNYDRVKSSFRAYKARQYAIRMMAGKSEPKWINFKQSNKDMQFVELQDKLRKRIMTVFQINDTELGYTSEVNKNASEVQSKIFNNKGLKPIIKLLEDHLNSEFVHEIDPNFYFRFERTTVLQEWEMFEQTVVQTDLMRIQFFNLAYQEGKITLNEWRKAVGELITAKRSVALKDFDFGNKSIVPSQSYVYLNSSLKATEDTILKQIAPATKNNAEIQQIDERIKNMSISEFSETVKNMINKDDTENDKKDSNSIADKLKNVITSMMPMSISNNTTKNINPNLNVIAPTINENKNVNSIIQSKTQPSRDVSTPSLPAKDNPTNSTVGIIPNSVGQKKGASSASKNVKVVGIQKPKK